MSSNQDQPTFEFAFLPIGKFSMLSLSAMVEPLRIANYCSGDRLYGWRFLSADGEPAVSSTGIPVPTEAVDMADHHWHAVIVCGGWNAERYENARLFHWLQLMARNGITIGASEIGTYVLAAAGLLQGYAVTIHWHCQNAFRERYPAIDLRDTLYHIDRKRMTCAGGNAGMDMVLHEIRHHSGRKLALEVADQLLYSQVRKAEMPQKGLEGRQQSTAPPSLQRAIEIMEHNIEKPLTIPEISSKLGFSQRKLERLFNKYFGCSAVAFYRTVRLQQARVLLTHTDMSVLDICIACGFASSSYFSKSYTNQFGVHPRDHRTAWPEGDDSPWWPGISTSAKPGVRHD